MITGLLVEQIPAARYVSRPPPTSVTIPAEEIEEIKRSTVSIMPEGQLENLTKEQVRDLIAYLAAKTQVPLPAK